MGQTQTKNDKKTKKKTKSKYESKEEYFIKNGGILLEKQIALSKGQHITKGQLKIFSNEDITKATNNYDPDLIVCSSNLRTVYKGILEDRVVAVRAPTVRVEPNPSLIDHHLTEASMAMVMNHSNIEKLIGCCLETYIPILVHEFVPNGSLFRHLHGDLGANVHLQWAHRLTVATDTAYALSYMHNALSKPVVHRHLASNIIILDDSFHAKLTHFGFSVPITPGETPEKWPVEGVPGYIDPEYVETQELTDKCDVYSFGVLLLELLTRRHPLMMAMRGVDLVDTFISAVERNCMMEMIDSEVLEQGTEDKIQQVAQLALKCVAEKGAERPTMIEVVKQLQLIRGQDQNKCLTEKDEGTSSA